MKKTVAPRPKKVPRYSGDALRRAVLAEAERRVELRYTMAWQGHPSPLRRPAGGWREWACDRLGSSHEMRDFRGWVRRYWPLQLALRKALREAKADAEVWRVMLEVSPALADVRFEHDDDCPLLNESSWRARLAQSIETNPEIASEFAASHREMHEMLNDFKPINENKADGLPYRLRLARGPIGPTWTMGKQPENSDLALLVILSGWISDRWRGEMSVSEAIEVVVDAVRSEMHTLRSVATEVR